MKGDVLKEKGGHNSPRSRSASKYALRLLLLLPLTLDCLSVCLSICLPVYLPIYLSIYLSAGIGFGLMYCPAIIVVTMYFEKKRGLATGIAVCGAGVGTFLYAPLNAFLIKNLSIRYTLLVHSG